MSYEEWKERVDRQIEREIGLSSDDLPDAPYTDWFEEEISPVEAAERVINSDDDYWE